MEYNFVYDLKSKSGYSLKDSKNLRQAVVDCIDIETGEVLHGTVLNLVDRRYRLCNDLFELSLCDKNWNHCELPTYVAAYRGGVYMIMDPVNVNYKAALCRTMGEPDSFGSILKVLDLTDKEFSVFKDEADAKKFSEFGYVLK